jgi:hypothetical protein
MIYDLHPQVLQPGLLNCQLAGTAPRLIAGEFANVFHQPQKLFGVTAKQRARRGGRQNLPGFPGRQGWPRYAFEQTAFGGVPV